MLSLYTHNFREAKAKAYYQALEQKQLEAYGRGVKTMPEFIGGDPYKADIPFKDLVEDKNWYRAYLKGTTLSDLIKFSIDEKDYINDSILYDSDLFFYTAPDIKDMIEKNIIKIHYFIYYHKWNPQENYYYCVENT